MFVTTRPLLWITFVGFCLVLGSARHFNLQERTQWAVLSSGQADHGRFGRHFALADFGNAL